jgi:hypothetical protein
MVLVPRTGITLRLEIAALSVQQRPDNNWPAERRMERQGKFIGWRVGHTQRHPAKTRPAVTHLKRIIVARLLVLTLSLLTLHFGGVSAVHQDAMDAIRSVNTGLNSLSYDVTGDIVNLHNHL